MVKNDSTSSLTCFKYRSGESALRCLVDGTLYFAKPSELNDTLEAKFDHADHDARNQVISDTLSEISQSRGGPPFSFVSPCPPDLAGVVDEENERFRNFCNEVGIFSAARRPDHQAMWAYYAENNQGVCFELEWPFSVLRDHQLFPVDVTYFGGARVHNSAHDWRRLFIALAEEHPDATLAELQELSLGPGFLRQRGILSTARVTSIKHTDWAHEKEIRVLAPKSGTQLLLSKVLKRVHFMRTDGKHWSDIMVQIHINYPLVQLVEWKMHHGVVTASAKGKVIRSIPIKND